MRVAATAQPAADCPNCAAPAAGRYCGACGQEQGPLAHTVRDLGREFVEEYFAYDNKVWRTLQRLLFRPGALTAEYLAGRRARYVRPLKLYLIASLVYFLAFGYQVSRGWSPFTDTSSLGARRRGEGVTAVAPSTRDAGAGASFDDVYRERKRRLARLTADQRERLLAEGLGRHLPHAMFALMPLFALILRVLYARSGRLYAEHFVFALHVHAFVFLAATIAVLAPVEGKRFDQAVVVVLTAYLALAMRRVYGGRRRWLAPRLVTLVAAYLIVLAVVLLGLILLTVFTAV